MPKGEPTKVVRLPVWLCEQIEGRARAGESIAQHIARTYNPKPLPAASKASRALQRCQCPKPTISKVVTNLCTTCKRLR